MEFRRHLSMALRQIRRRPGVPIVIVLTLAFAMGVSTSLFSVANAVWLTPWSTPDAARVRVVSPAVPIDVWQLWAEHSRAFSELAARHGLAFARLGDDVVHLDFVSANYFQVLRVPMFMGRAFTTAEASGASGTAVVGHHVWQTRFAGDAGIVGRTITLSPLDRSSRGATFTIVGVAAPGFEGPDLLRTELWLPQAAAGRLQYPPAAGRQVVSAFGRLAPGVSHRQAETELDTLTLDSGERPSREPVAVRSTVRWSQRAAPAQTRLLWGTMLVGISLITLIASASVSNLMLARGHARRGEIALRLALGATRAQVITDLLIESSLLCLIAGGLAVAVASWLPETLYRLLVENTSPTLSHWFQLTFPIDRRVFGFGLGMSATACIAFGLWPALRCSRDVSTSELVKATQHISGRALMPSLISCQTIVSVMALAISGLILRSGPVTEARVLRSSVADLSVVRPDTLRQLDAARRETLVTATLERLEAVVGRNNVAGLVGQMQAGADQVLRVTPTYFGVLRIPWVAGRTFAGSDPPAQVVVINEAFARRLPTGEEIVGRILTPRDAQTWDRRLDGRQVVGIVRDSQVASATAYVPVVRGDAPDLLVRGSRDHVLREATLAVAALDRSVATQVLSGSDWIAPAIGPSWFVASVIVVFGVVTLLLGAIGLFSFLEFSVQQRTREIGIRRALGAGIRHVVHAVVQPAARPLARGLLLGCATAAGAGYIMQQAQLPAGIEPLDVATYASVAAAVIVTFVLASCGPASRATRHEPDKVLRYDG